MTRLRKPSKPHPMAQDARRDEWVPVYVSVYEYTPQAVTVMPMTPWGRALPSLPATLTYLQRIGVSALREGFVRDPVLVSELTAEQRSTSLDAQAIAWVPRWILEDRGLTPMGPRP